MKTRYKIAIVVSIIIAVGTISTLAYLTQTDFFIVPKRSGNQWSNTELDCPENFIIYENNCVPVNSENREVHDASLFFKSVDGTITELCKIDFEEIPEVETCKEIPLHHITEFNEIIIQWDYEDWRAPEPITATNVVDANNQFALDFYSEISDTEENLFFSPTSIDAVFAIVYEGAQGETTKNMEETFGFTKDDIQRREQYKKSIDILNKKDLRYSLNTANALWLSDRYELNPEYVDVAKTYYDGTVQNVDFVSNQGVDAINQWVSQKTNGKIGKLFEQDSTDELTLLAITNTIYFKGEWEYPFVPGLTWDADFFVDKDKTVKVKMMNRRINPINHMQNDLVQMIELPYKGDRLSMLVLLPSEKNEISKLEGQLLVNNLNQWKSQMSETMAEVYLPKFAADTDYNLKSILQDMGMDIPFDKEKADLSGIAPYPGIYIDTAVHKAAVEVNELGTEAAAATGAMAKLQSGPPTTFRANHPFVYMIEDKSTGQILFMGRVMDPTS